MIFSSRWNTSQPGSKIRISSKLEGFEGCELYYQWMVDKGNGFEAIEGANAADYSFIEDEENIYWAWKLQVYFR